MTNSTSSRFDVYEAITNQIVSAIEAGTGQVQLPWHRKGSAIHRPINVASRNSYRGVNTVALWAAADANGFADGVWGTYRQWQERGAQVRKGEKSSLVIFYKDYAPADGSASEDDPERRFVARASRVFNVAQVEGYVSPDAEASDDKIDPCEAAERFIAASGAKISIGGDRAFYRPSADIIAMPDRHRFIGTETSTATEGWYATLLHELTHWTGAANRCDRIFGKRFGDDAYAMEEMVAELGAAFLCGDFGITAEPRADHAAYIDNWLRILKSDRKAIFTAASAANKAAEYLFGIAQADYRAAA